MDAIADISAVCLAMDALKIDRITASAVVTGFGTVRCAHGLLPVPAPATAELLTSLPTSAGDIEGELCTPTGAALVRHFADSFGTRPDMVLRGTGRGLGTRNFSRPNILQVFLGDGEVSLQTGTSVRESAAARPDTAAPSLTDTVVELACNLDDMTGEEIGFAAETLLEKGALDVWMQSIQMKKFRPGTLLSVLCRPEEEDRFVRLLFKYTTTLGVRRTLHERYILTREESDVTVQTEKADTRRGTAREETAADGAITMRKKTSRGYGVIRSKYEYDDLAEIAWATGQTLREVRDSL